MHAATAKPLQLRFGAIASEGPSAAFVFAVVTANAAADGGYFPTAWGWSALGCLLVAFGVLMLQERPSLTRLDWVFLASLLVLLAWTASSAIWSASAGRSMQEAERTAIYASAVLALLVLARDGAATAVAVGVSASATVVSAYALATRLLPDVFGYAGAGAYRLARPVGYWNGLAVLAALGLVLSLGLAVGASRRTLRIAASASLPILALTLYFTFSRGGWLALALGLAVSFALDPRRLKAAAPAAVLAALSAAAVGVASHAPALVESGQPYACAVGEGHRLALALAVLVAASAVVAAVEMPPRRRPLVPGSGEMRRVRITLLVVLALGAGAAVPLALLGGADGLVGTTCHTSSVAQSGQTPALSNRLFSGSGNSRVDYWRVALTDYSHHPVLGSGAGTWELYWSRERPAPVGSRFAHNLYLQTLAELGPIALVLLAVMLAAPLAALRSTRRIALVPAAAGAYAAGVAHAALDWDWQLPAVMLAALFAGAAILAAAGEVTSSQPLSRGARAACLCIVVALTALAATGWVGNRTLALSAHALAQGRYREAAERARTAQRWQPWASEPWRELGLAEIGRRRIEAARSSFLHAVAKDRLDWQTWADLALATHGAQRSAALRNAQRLNPLGYRVEAAAAGR